ncbi:uncharacterized protein LOC113278865 [Papaver somniferum]|uniref:uncharacterized protein LOC113278865 n=1 Tax=Papaver somniferum TaxID=3469 RepID=UPI000E70038A|nr:uncharacterized protein LOC113278865 [Papaver somniferum]
MMKSKYARTSDGQRMMATVSSNEFWENVTFSFQVLAQSVEVVRMVDIERKPFMGYIYEVVSRSEKIDSDEAYRVVKEGLYKAMERLIPDPKDYDQAMFDLRTYRDATRSLGSASAIRTRDTMRPHDWWILHGVGVPCLQKFVIRVLSLTISDSPCERNWSTFENLYSKKRNKFLQQKLKAFDEDDDWLIPEGGGLVREGEDLTWEQANASIGAMDVGPSTRSRRKERSDTHPIFSLISEEPDDETLPPYDDDSEDSDDTSFQFEKDFDKRMHSNRRNRADRDEGGDEEGDDRIEL